MCELQFLTQRDRNDVSIEKIVSSVTRFDEISPLWQHFEGLFLTSLGYPALPGMIQNRY